MVKQNWNISDEEKNRILNLHESATKKLYLVSEQEQPKQFSVDFGNVFESGKYKFNPEYQKIVTDKVQEISNYIKNNNLKDYKIVITPSESQVPNQPPFNQPKSLAEARGKYLKTQLEALLTPLLNFTPKIEVLPALIGDVKWDEKKGKNHSDYKKDQFVKVSVVLTTQTPQITISNDDESIFDINNHLTGFIKSETRDSKNISDSGIVNGNYRNKIFVKIEITPGATPPYKQVAAYEVPWEWWNSKRDVPGANKITQKDLEQIEKFKKIA